MKTPIRVLYINNNGALGGSQRSLVELIENFPENSIAPFVLSPKGAVINVFSEKNISYVSFPWNFPKFDHTRYSHYQGLRWLILFREILLSIPTIWFFFKNRNLWRKNFDLIHINDGTLILPLILAKKILKKPIVVHIRTIMNNNRSLWRTRFVNHIYDNFTSAVIAIDETVESSLITKNKPVVIYNSLNIKKNTPDQQFNQMLIDIPVRQLTLGYIGTISKSKGLLVALETMKNLIRQGLDINLVMVGNNVNDKRNIINLLRDKLTFGSNLTSKIKGIVQKNELSRYIYILPKTYDLSSFYKSIDAVIFPTLLNGIGRPVIEGSFYGKPSIVSLESDTPFFKNMEHGIIVKSGDSGQLEDAIKTYYFNREMLIKHGEAAKINSEEFDCVKNTNKVLDLYKKILNAG